MTDSFLPLVKAQAKARRLSPRLIVIKHPLGSLDAEALRGRVDAGYEGLLAHLKEMGVLK